MKTLRATLPAALIVLAPMVMLYPLWSNPTSAGEDDVIYYYPLRKMVGRALREGNWPLHNPLEATGMPLMADPQSAVMYPPTWLFAAIDAKLAYSVTLFLAFSLAGGGAYLYLRRLGLIRPASAFGAVTFMFCGFLVGHRVHWSFLHAAAYLPWGLWCIEGLRRRPAAAFAWMVPVSYLTITAGHLPTGIHVGLVWLAYLLLRGRPFWRSLGIGVAALVLAAALAGPQIDATRRLLAAATRSRIGYATAGENSFFPPAAALALLPMLMGSRTPNFYPQQWWGPWHLCEMLGYVGLSTLVLALSAVRCLYRKGKPAGSPDQPGDSRPQPSRADTQATAPDPRASGPGPTNRLQPLVRVWTWIAIGAGVWMLGYYLPTYRLVHMLPVLGYVRCPARMVLAVDMALAALAGVAIHTICVTGEPQLGGPGRDRAERLRRSVFRGSIGVLPAAMAVTYVAVAAAAWISSLFLSGQLIFFVGGAGDALEAIRPTNPAVWIPVVLLIVTVAAVRLWLVAPRPRAMMLVGLALVDLFFVTRFVDVPGSNAVAPDPEVSPAARCLPADAQKDEPFRIWAIGETYCDRGAELLRPKTAHSLGFATINSYGPFQSPAHAQLFGFRIFGTNRDWARLLRGNYLLSLYGVRYILTSRREVRDVIESVRIPSGPPPPEGPNLLSRNWWLDWSERDGDVLRLRTPLLWRWSIAKQPVKLRPGVVYRISLDARGPDRGAASFLRAEMFQQLDKHRYFQADELGLTAAAEQIGTEWRHFEWTFRAPGDLSGQILFRVFTMSERTIEVRRIELRESHWDRPVDLGGRGRPGEAVYRLVASVAAVDPDDPPVAIYENRLFLPRRRRPPQAPAGPAEIEALKWHKGELSLRREGFTLPDVGLRVEADPQRVLLMTTLPAAAVYVMAAVGALCLGRGRRES